MGCPGSSSSYLDLPLAQKVDLVATSSGNMPDDRSFNQHYLQERSGTVTNSQISLPPTLKSSAKKFTNDPAQ